MYNFTHHFNSKPLFPSATRSGLDCSRASGPPISSSPGVVLSLEKLCPLIFRQQPMGNDHVSQPEEKEDPQYGLSLSTAPQAKKGAPDIYWCIGSPRRTGRPIHHCFLRQVTETKVFHMLWLQRHATSNQSVRAGMGDLTKPS